MSEILAIYGAKTFSAENGEERGEGGGESLCTGKPVFLSVCLSPSLLSWEVDQGLVLLGRQVVTPRVWFGEGVLVASQRGDAAS